MSELREETAERREACRERILRAVGDNGRVLTELLPELEETIGAPPVLAQLDPFEAQTRLHVTLQAFVQVFATPGKPLVIFLDDLHWADAASLEALRVLATDPDGKHMLLLGAFRPRDVGLGHPLARFESELRRARMPASRVDLPPLTEKAVVALLGDALGAPAAQVAPLAELLARKTAGNPFFLRQLLGTLHKTGLLAFDLRERRWRWGIAQIERVGITENVVELLLKGIRRLPEETRDLLPLAACFGKVASLGMLASISDGSKIETRAALEPAFREGLLLADAEPGKYRFAHDRVQQAAYSLLTEPRREELHLQIGRLLVARSVARTEDATFEATDQMNLGVGALMDPGERLDLARLNHRAGLKAKAATAFGPALSYLRSGLALLPSDAWKTDPDLAMLLQREAAECAYLAGDYPLSDELVEDALGRATSTVQKVDLHNLRVVSATARAAWQEALDHGRRALAELGYSLSFASGDDIEPAIAEELRAVDALFNGRAPDVLLDVPLMTDPADQAVLRLLVNLAHPAWWYRDRGLFRLLTYRALRFILERGHGPESMTALCDVAMCLSSQDRFDEADAFGSIAQDLAWRFGHPGQQAHAQFLYATFVQRWRHPYSVVCTQLRRALESAKKVGEMRSAAYALSATVIFEFAAGRELDGLLRDLEDDLPFLRKTRNEGILAFHLCYRQSVRCLKGLTAGRNQFAEPGFDEAMFLRAAEGVPSLVCLYWIRRLHTSFIFRDFVAAHGYAEAASQLMASMAGYVPAIDYVPTARSVWRPSARRGPQASAPNGWARSPKTSGGSRAGRRAARPTFVISTCWSRPRSRGSIAGWPRRRTSTTKPSRPPPREDSFTTPRWRVSLPAVTRSREGGSGLPISTCERRASDTPDGGRRRRCAHSKRNSRRWAAPSQRARAQPFETAIPRHPQPAQVGRDNLHRGRSRSAARAARGRVRRGGGRRPGRRGPRGGRRALRARHGDGGRAGRPRAHAALAHRAPRTPRD